MSLTIELETDTETALNRIARQRGIRLEELAIRELQGVVAREREFESVSDYVLDKNAELHRRLAK